MKLTKIALLTSASFIALAGTSVNAAETLVEALTTGKTTGNINLRYESVDDSTNKDADALTVRTRLNYTTAGYKGFTAAVEFEDSRQALGMDEYNNTNGEGTEYAVIADPETTELDQAYLQYKKDKFTAKVGRQVITMDNHRFVGHVGWRQDRQTFDALSASYAFSDKLNASYAYISQRNRIFAEAKDFDSEDHLINVSYKSDIGKFTAYSYMLEVEDSDNPIDTYGIRYNGSSKIDTTKIGYTFEYATQTQEIADGTEYDTDYLLAEVSANVSGLNFKLGYELLGSDDGAKGFTTPLATLHKFNGWADKFLGTPDEGLQDIYASVGGKLAGGKWSVTYHQFDADEASDAKDELGSEIDAVYTRGFGKNLVGGIKYAAYSADDHGTDTDKLWVWTQVKF